MINIKMLASSKRKSLLLGDLIASPMNPLLMDEGEFRQCLKQHYSVTYLSIFDHWLNEEESHQMITPYFSEFSQPLGRLTLMINERYEQPFLNYFAYIDELTDLRVIWADPEQDFALKYFKPESMDELLTYVLFSVREVQQFNLIDVKTKTIFEFCHDFTLLKATPKGNQWSWEAKFLNVIDRL